MGLLSNKIDRQELQPGDHIYCWRQAFIYAHHGIYVGDEKVIHFTQGPAGQEIGNFNISSSLPAPQYSEIPCPQCGDHYSSFNNGVILSCINCFLSGGELKLFEYGVSRAYFIANVRGGTCTVATSDPPGDVLHRAYFLLENGFGNYDLLKNNCENFAIYCKTCLLVIIPSTRVGQSGQVAALESTSGLIFSSLALLTYKFKGFAAVGSVYYGCSGVYYCYSRLNSDIGVRRDVARVAVESLAPPAPVPPAPVERLVPTAPPAPFERLVPPAPSLVPPAPVERLVPPAPLALVEKLVPTAPPAPVERLVPSAPSLVPLAPVERLIPPAPPAPVERLVPPAPSLFPPTPAERLVPPAPSLVPPSPVERLVPTAPPSLALVGRFVPPAPAPAPTPVSYCLSINQGIANVLMLVALFSRLRDCICKIHHIPTRSTWIYLVVELLIVVFGVGVHLY